MTAHSYIVEGRRVWMTTPYGSAYTPRLKRLGAHWDRDRRQWWIGTASADAAIAVMDEAITAESAPAVTVHIDLDCAVPLTSARYGHTYAAAVDGAVIVSTRRGEDVTVMAPFVSPVVGSITASAGTLWWESGTVVAAEVPAPMAAQWIADGWATQPGTPHLSDRRTPRCDDCGRLAYDGVIEVRDMSGLMGRACHGCARQASFA